MVGSKYGNFSMKGVVKPKPELLATCEKNMFLSLWDLLPRCLHILHDVNAVLPVPAYHLIPALPQK